MRIEADAWHAAPLAMTNPNDRIDVWRVCLDSGRQFQREWCGIPAPDEAARASRFHFEDDRGRYIIGRAALRIILGLYLDLTPVKIHFRYEKNGKPEIDTPQDSRGLRFNVSHSGGLALIAVSSSGAIGVDIEKIHAKPDCLDIARRWLPGGSYLGGRGGAPRSPGIRTGHTHSILDS